jgi:hypothetical protein
MTRMSTVRKIPNTMILIAHSDLREWLARCFTRIDFAQFTITARPFAVKALSADDFSAFGHGRADHNTDVGIALAVVNSELENT